MAKRKSKPLAKRAPAVQAKAKRMIEKLREHYRLGRKALHAKRTKGTSTKDFADRQGTNEHTLRKFKLFAREYRLRDLDALRKPRPNGLPLQWGHVNYLLTIDYKTEREAMQERAIKEGWTAPQLYAAIRAKRSPRDHSHGRPMQKPATPEVGLQQLTAEAAMWIRRCEVVMSAFERGNETKASAGLRRRAKEALDVLAKVEKTAHEVAGDLLKLLL